MPTLVIAIPFRPDPKCDLDQMAKDFQQEFAASSCKKLPEHVCAEIKEIRLVYQNEGYACAEGDVVIAYGHGGDDNADLSNNQGQWVKPKDVIEMLEGINAQAAERVLFMACYSALENHAAPLWKEG